MRQFKKVGRIGTVKPSAYREKPTVCIYHMFEDRAEVGSLRTSKISEESFFNFGSISGTALKFYPLQAFDSSSQ